MNDANALDDPLVEEIMSGFKQNAREVMKDTLEGIGMFGFAASLIGYLGLLITVYTFILVYTGYYRLSQPLGAVGTFGALGAVVMLVFFYLHFRRKHLTLRKKYSSLFALYEKLGAA